MVGGEPRIEMFLDHRVGFGKGVLHFLAKNWSEVLRSTAAYQDVQQIYPCNLVFGDYPLDALITKIGNIT